MAAAAAAAPATASKGAPSADSYIGSLISLTSKSEIRYEGVLYNINTEESSIGLRNVRSFGTEGRKKDGQQIPPSDKIYEYILFRGSDIKDLQVKSSPSVQTGPPSIHNDPAIIQSQYSHPAAPASTSTSMLSVGSGSGADPSSHTAQMMPPRSTFQSGLPLYQPGGNLGSWAPTQPPTANGSGLAMPPMYWQGYYSPPPGMPHLQPPPLLRPPGPPGLPMPHSMQQPLQYPGMNPSLQAGSHNLPSNLLLQSGLPNFPAPNTSLQSTSLPGISASYGFSDSSGVSSSLPSVPSNLTATVSMVPGDTKVPGSNMSSLSGSVNLPELPSSLLPPVGGNLESTTLTRPTQSTSTQASSLVPSTPLSPLPNMPPVVPLTPTALGDNLVASSVPSGLEFTLTSSYSKPKVPMSTESIRQFTSSSVPSVLAPSSTSPVKASHASLPPVDQMLQSGSSTLSSTQPMQRNHKVVEVKPTSSEPLKQSPAETKEAILPLPSSSVHKNEAPLHPHHGGRGRGQGRGSAFSRTASNFAEDFDFTAMNEKFNKDEVWGHLGKSKGHLREKEGQVVDESDDMEDIPVEDGENYLKLGNKPVYVKDDFFDSLSCNALDGGTRNGRPRFSEQRKIDTETFGDTSRYRISRGGGRGFRGGGGRSRGSFRGRGYGYTGRGRGRAY